MKYKSKLETNHFKLLFQVGNPPSQVVTNGGDDTNYK